VVSITRLRELSEGEPPGLPLRPRPAWAIIAERSTPPELVEFRAALKAYEAGDEGPIWAWAEEFVGEPLDALFRAALAKWLKYGKRMPLFALFRFMRYQRRRLSTAEPKW